MIIGLFLRHIKAYKGINFIPIGFEHSFISYIGENGSGKSSILEALNAFFNNKRYIINKDALSDSISGLNNPFILPIFLIEKTKLTTHKKEFEKISEFFWTIQKKDLTPGIQGSTKEFFEIREEIIDQKDTHYLILMGETNFSAGHKTSFGSFHNEENFLIHLLDKKKTEIEWDRKTIIAEWTDELNKKLDSADWKRILQELKDIYSYVYLPVELEVESFTKIETDEMQKIFDKNLKKEIENALTDLKIKNNTVITQINTKLDNFIDSIEDILNNEYSYDTGVQRGNTVTKTDIVEKIIESYFQKRILHKGKKKVSELSAWEKRQALISLVYAFLAKTQAREKNVIIAIDEPENSLHTSLCYDQFEKLQEISDKNQVLITTHWYGFLPTINKGIWHFLNSKNTEIEFETYDLYDYKSKVQSDSNATRRELPHDFHLKSTNDLVQSIFYSLNKNDPYNWLIVEGISEKIYCEYFLRGEIKDKKLRILCLGGQKKVSELYEYLELPIKNEKENLKGKIYCLVDTDQADHKKDIADWYDNLKIRRLSNKNDNEKTELLCLSNSDNSVCDIEQSLNPIIFQKTINELDTKESYKIVTIENENGNCHFLKNFKNLEIENFFKENDGENKVLFAQKYVEIMNKEKDQKKYCPNWISELTAFFSS